MAFKARTALPTCQIGIYDGIVPDGEHDCGKAAVAKWNWGDGDLFVCEECDEEIARQEEGANVITIF